METLDSRELLTSLTGDASGPAEADFVGMDSFIYTVVDDGTTVGSSAEEREIPSLDWGDSDSTRWASAPYKQFHFQVDWSGDSSTQAVDAFFAETGESDEVEAASATNQLWGDWFIVQEGRAQATDDVFVDGVILATRDADGDLDIYVTNGPGMTDAASQEGAWRSISHDGIRFAK